MTYIFGSIPPPIGGVSVFVHRHSGRLRREGVPHRVVDWAKIKVLGRISWVLRIAFDPRPARYEINGFLTWPMVGLLFRPFSAEIEHWVHSGQFSDTLNGWRKRLYARFLRRADACVLVSPHIRPMFERNGLGLPTDTRVQNAFLPPVEEEEERVLNTYDSETMAFVSAHRPLLVMQGADAFHDGVDRYGTDVAVEAMPAILHQYPQAGLLVGRPSEGGDRYRAYFKGLLRTIETDGTDSAIHFMTGEREMWPLTKRADVFLRPSNQDGDSISIREAELFGVPIIASDACPRPDCAHLFRNRDAAHLAEQVIEVWSAAESVPAG